MGSALSCELFVSSARHLNSQLGNRFPDGCVWGGGVHSVKSILWVQFKLQGKRWLWGYYGVTPQVVHIWWLQVNDTRHLPEKLMPFELSPLKLALHSRSLLWLFRQIEMCRDAIQLKCEWILKTFFFVFRFVCVVAFQSPLALKLYKSNPISSIGTLQNVLL